MVSTSQSQWCIAYTHNSYMYITLLIHSRMHPNQLVIILFAHQPHSSLAYTLQPHSVASDLLINHVTLVVRRLLTHTYIINWTSMLYVVIPYQMSHYPILIEMPQVLTPPPRACGQLGIPPYYPSHDLLTFSLNGLATLHSPMCMCYAIQHYEFKDCKTTGLVLSTTDTSETASYYQEVPASTFGVASYMQIYRCVCVSFYGITGNQEWQDTIYSTGETKSSQVEKREGRGKDKGEREERGVVRAGNECQLSEQHWDKEKRQHIAVWRRELNGEQVFRQALSCKPTVTRSYCLYALK